MRSDHERFLDILEAIERIEEYARQGRDVFEREELIQTRVVHHLEIIGEAATALSEDTHNAHPEVPWRQIIGMRNILVHHYFGIDLPVVWSVVEHDLEPLKENIERVVAALPDDGRAENEAR